MLDKIDAFGCDRFLHGSEKLRQLVSVGLEVAGGAPVAEQRPDVGWGGNFSRFDPGRDYPGSVVDADASLAPAPSTSCDAPVGEFDADDRTQPAVDAPKPAGHDPGRRP
jgi:hypothetical protein